MPRFEVIKDGAVIPTRGTLKSAGYDLTALIYERTDIFPGETKLFPTGITVQMADDEWLEVKGRSGLSLKKGLICGAGVIDADYYPNDIGVVLHNVSNKVVTIEPGDRIAQGVFHKYLITDDDEAKGERQGGFGSTGK